MKLEKPGRSAWLVIAAAIVGCGGSSHPLAPVAGQIMLDGQPLAGATVTFQPIGEGMQRGDAGSGSFGKTDEQGRYQLETVLGGAAGAVVGPHAVTISRVESSSTQSDSGEGVRDVVPEKFRDGSLRFDVPAEGTDQANFDVSSAS
ncbi:MAG: hypothetical protein KDA42_06440 [Planctomycetales bacterium]|nr:hypothetical protein [Planctomycetales bacterium]